MSLLVAYNRITEKELLETTVENIAQVGDWFEKNPKRRICRAELWYGRVYRLTRKNYVQQIQEAARLVQVKEAREAEKIPVSAREFMQELEARIEAGEGRELKLK